MLDEVKTFQEEWYSGPEIIQKWMRYQNKW